MNGLWAGFRRVAQQRSTFPLGVVVPWTATPEISSMRWDFFWGIYEDGEIEAMLPLLRPDDRVLELGACLGVVTTIACRATPQGAVLAYEANPSLEPSIRAITSANGVAPDVRMAAIGVADTTMSMFIGRNIHQTSSIENRTTTAAVQVPVHDFRRVVAEFRPTVVLFDIEGTERDIFAEPLPDHVRVVSGEMHPSILGRDGVAAIIANLERQGFRRTPARKRDVMSFVRVN